MGRSRPAPVFEPAYPSNGTILWEGRVIRGQLIAAGLDVQEVDDLHQEVLIAAITAVRQGRFRPHPGYSMGPAVRSWMRRIALNLLHAWRRKAYRRREVPTIAPPEYADTHSPSLEARAAAWDTLRALAVLPPNLRDVVALQALGWTLQEIALHLAVPKGTVATRLRAARKRIRKMIQRKRGQ